MSAGEKYEVNIRNLEEIIRRLERGELTLEEGLASFEAGIRLIKNCQSELDRVSQRIQSLTRDGKLKELEDNFGEG